MNSFWITRRAYMYEAIPDSATTWTKWRVYTRRLLIVVSVFLGIAWCSSSIILEADPHWNEKDPRKCHHYNDITYKDTAKPYTWTWIAGLGIYQAALILSFVDYKDHKDHEDREGRFSGKWFSKEWKSLGKAPENFFKEKLKHCSNKAAKKFFWIMIRFAWLSRTLISVWSYGDSDKPEYYFFYYVFISWDTWDIIMLKVMNGPLVKDETKMGFGQVLPLVLLVQIFLNVVDIWKST